MARPTASRALPGAWSPQPGAPAQPALLACPSCGGFGDHGLDDEGKPFVCYTCYGEGVVAPERLEPSEQGDAL